MTFTKFINVYTMQRQSVLYDTGVGGWEKECKGRVQCSTDAWRCDSLKWYVWGVFVWGGLKEQLARFVYYAEEIDEVSEWEERRGGLFDVYSQFGGAGGTSVQEENVYTIYNLPWVRLNRCGLCVYVCLWNT